MIIVLLTIVFVLWVLIKRWQRRRIRKISEEIPSGSFNKLPVIGHAHLLGGNHEDIMSVFKEMATISISQGGLSTFWLANKLYLIVTDPDVADLISKSCLHKDNFTMKYMRTFLGNGSIFAPVNIWRPRRKILAPLFSMKNLNQFVEIFDKQSNIMGQLLKKEGREDFSLWTYATTYTFDSVCESTLDVKLNSQLNPSHPFLKGFEKASQLLAKRIATPWYHPDVIYKRMEVYKEYMKIKHDMYAFVTELIVKKKKELANYKNDPLEEAKMRSFLEMMIIESGEENGYSELELCEEILVLLIAGTDTSAVGACYTAVMLSRYQDVQYKVYQELQEVFGDSNRPVTVQDLPKLKYLDAVIKETLRIYPPVPVVVREVHNDVVLPNGTTLVEGVSILLNIWGTHRNHHYWGKDTDVFRPERFLEGPLKHPVQFIPFSHASRNCLGYNYAMMSMKTAVTNLLRNHKILPPKDMHESQYKEPLRVKFDIMMKPVDDFIVRLEPRKV